ncbi:MAG: hypothetical protein QOJ70_3046 [Acidobacteriota bacterium]|jgi:hypothetical protein|nr:hypothetical protein [Acidobacteriota bacterium]
MPGDDNKSEGVTEYHVAYVIAPEVPEPRWEVQWDGGFIGHEAWDKSFAISTAKERAKKSRPSKVIIHDLNTGEPESEISFAADTLRHDEGVSRRLD